MVVLRSVHYSALIAAGVIGSGLASEGCAGSVPAGSSCDRTSDCESGLSCLYPVGSGCVARGRCIVATNDCSTLGAGLSICSCGAPLDLTCIPSSFALSQPTRTGAACGSDAATGAVDGSVEQ